MKTSFSSKIFTTGLAVVYTLTNGVFLHAAETNMWRDRQRAIQGSSPIQLAALPLPPNFQLPISKQIPNFNFPISRRLPFAWNFQPYGSVRKISLPKSGKTDRVVIHIQDVHRNLEAQENIGRAVSDLIEKHRVDLVTLEGAFRPLDFSAFHTFPDQATVREVAEHLFQEKKISGPIRAVLTNHRSDVSVIGVDDETHYRANVEAYRRSIPLKKSLEQKLANSEEEIAREKEKTFSVELRTFDQVVQAYRLGNVSSSDYAARLAEKAPVAPSAVERFLSALRMEKSLDFQALEAERARLLRDLVKKLNEKESRELIDLSTAFRAGQLNHADFYSALQELCDQVQVPLSSYKGMQTYIQYVITADSISAEELLTSLREMETGLYKSLVRTTQEKELVEKSRMQFLSRRLLDFALTREEWNEYKKTRKNMFPSPSGEGAGVGFPAAAETGLLRFRGSEPPSWPPPVGGRNNTLGYGRKVLGQVLGTSSSPFEDFYLEAENRDKAMAENLLRAVRRTAPSTQDTERSTVVLVTGGFHSTGIDKLLTDAGCAVITFTPKISKTDSSSGSVYLSVFAQEKTPLEKLFQGEKLFLAQEAFPRALEGEAGAQIAGRAVMKQTVSPDVAGSWYKKLTGFFHVAIERVGTELVLIMTQKSATSPSVDLRVTRDWAIRMTVKKPLFETIVLWGMRAAALWLCGFGTFWTPIVLGVIFSLAHPDLYRAPADGTSRLWHVLKLLFVRIALGWYFVTLLAEPYGVLKSLSVHAAYNGIVVAARTAVQDWGWKNRVVIFIANLPLAVFRASTDMNVYTVGVTNIVNKPDRGPVLKIDQTKSMEKEVEEKISEDTVSTEIDYFKKYYDTMSAEATTDEDFFLLERILNFTMVNTIVGQVERRISEHLEPCYVAIRRVCDELAEKPEYKNKPLNMDRLDAGRLYADELEKHIKGETKEEIDPISEIKYPVILVVRNPDNVEMTRLLMQHRKKIKAIVLEGPYDHRHWASVLAVGSYRPEEQPIPVLGDLDSNSRKTIYEAVNDGDELAIDTNNRWVRINPSQSEQEEVDYEIEEQTAMDEVLGEWSKSKVTTSDGVAAPLSCVLGAFPDDLQIQHINKVANGNVGLFRTEILFQTLNPLETEDNLVDRFVSLATALDGKLKIRAIDRKPRDKKTIFDDQPDGDKGELEWLLDTPYGSDVFRRLCRVMLKAYAKLPANHKNIEFFIPMVEKKEQVDKALEIVNSVKDELQLGQLEMKFGVMIETRLDPKTLNAIVGHPGVNFVSIGTRDLTVNIDVKDIIAPEYLQTVRDIVETAVKKGKEVGICGSQTTNEPFVTWIYSLPIPHERIPCLAILGGNFAWVKGLIRGVSRRELIREIGGGFSSEDIEKIHAMTSAAQLIRENTVKQSPEFEERFHTHLIQQGPARALWGDFIKGIGSLVSLTVEAPAAHVPLNKAKKTGYDFTYLLVAARYVVASLQYTATNGNEAVVHLTKIMITWVDRAIFGRDTRNRIVVVGSEGHRTGKDGQGVLAMGSELGFGNKLQEVLLPSIETPGGLTVKNKTGTVIGRVIGDPGTLGKLPDAYMFKIVAARSLDQLDLASVIEDSHLAENAIDLANAAVQMVQKSRTILNRDPSIGVLLRDRHQGMIEAILKELNIQKAYEDIKKEVEQSAEGYVDYPSESGAILRVYEYDDWSAGLSLGLGEELDFFLGISGSIETKMSAVLAKKLSGRVATVLVPYDNKPDFLFSELAEFYRQGLQRSDLNQIYTENDLIPGHPEDIACTISVLQDFQWEKNHRVTGPHVNEKGQIDLNVLWVGQGKVTPVKMKFTTIIESLLSKIEKEPNPEDAIKLIAAWVRFGRYDRAWGVVQEWKRKSSSDPLLLKKWEIMALFLQAGQILVQKSGSSDNLVKQAVRNYEGALQLVAREPDLAYLEPLLSLRQRIRRLLYWLRTREVRKSESIVGAGREEHLQEALRYSQEAISHADRGFGIWIADCRLQLKSIVDEYQHSYDEQWAAQRKAPSLEERLEAAYDAFYNHREETSITSYASWLTSHGSNLATAFLLTTVLADEPLDIQARVVRFLLTNKTAKEHAQRIEDETLLTPKEYAKSMMKIFDVAELNMAWQESRLALARTDRILIRPEIQQLLPNMQTRPHAHRAVAELILADMAAADIMPALGNKAGRIAYLKDADVWARMVDEYPRMFGETPLPLLFDLSLLYEQLLREVGDESYRQLAKKYTGIISDDATFTAFLKGIKDELGLPIYSDDDIREWNAKRDALLEDHRKLLKEVGTASQGGTSPEEIVAITLPSTYDRNENHPEVARLRNTEGETAALRYIEVHLAPWDLWEITGSFFGWNFISDHDNTTNGVFDQAKYNTRFWGRIWIAFPFWIVLVAFVAGLIITASGNLSPPYLWWFAPSFLLSLVWNIFFHKRHNIKNTNAPLTADGRPHLDDPITETTFEGPRAKQIAQALVNQTATSEKPIRTLRDLSRWYRQQLLKLRRIGPKSIPIINKTLALVGQAIENAPRFLDKLGRKARPLKVEKKPHNTEMATVRAVYRTLMILNIAVFEAVSKYKNAETDDEKEVAKMFYAHIKEELIELRDKVLVPAAKLKDTNRRRRYITLREEMIEKINKAILLIEEHRGVATNMVLVPAIQSTGEEYKNLLGVKIQWLRNSRRLRPKFRHVYDPEDKKWKWSLELGRYHRYDVGSHSIPLREYGKLLFNTLWETFRAVDHIIDTELTYQVDITLAQEKLRVLEASLNQLKEAKNRAPREWQPQPADLAAIHAGLLGLEDGLKSNTIVEMELAGLAAATADILVQLEDTNSALSLVTLTLGLLQLRLDEVKAIIHYTERTRVRPIRKYLNERNNLLERSFPALRQAAVQNPPSQRPFWRLTQPVLKKLRKTEEPDLKNVGPLLIEAGRSLFFLVSLDYYGGYGSTVFSRARAYVERAFLLLDHKIKVARWTHDFMQRYRSRFKILRLRGVPQEEAMERAFHREFEWFLSKHHIVRNTPDRRYSPQNNWWWYRLYQTVFVPLNIDATANGSSHEQNETRRIPNPLFNAFSLLIDMLEINKISDILSFRYVTLSHVTTPRTLAFLSGIDGKNNLFDLNTAQKEELIHAVAQDSSTPEVEVNPEEILKAVELRNKYQPRRADEPEISPASNPGLAMNRYTVELFNGDLESAADKAHITEEAKYSAFFLNTSWFLWVFGNVHSSAPMVIITLQFIFYLCSAYKFGFSHERLYRTHPITGKIIDAGPTSVGQKIAYSLLGAVFRIGYPFAFFLPWYGAFGALALAFILHWAYNKLARHLGLWMATATKKPSQPAQELKVGDVVFSKENKATGAITRVWDDEGGVHYHVQFPTRYVDYDDEEALEDLQYLNSTQLNVGDAGNNATDDDAVDEGEEIVHLEKEELKPFIRHIAKVAKTGQQISIDDLIGFYPAGYLPAESLKFALNEVKKLGRQPTDGDLQKINDALKLNVHEYRALTLAFFPKQGAPIEHIDYGDNTVQVEAQIVLAAVEARETDLGVRSYLNANGSLHGMSREDVGMLVDTLRTEEYDTQIRNIKLDWLEWQRVLLPFFLSPDSIVKLSELQAKKNVVRPVTQNDTDAIQKVLDRDSTQRMYVIADQESAEIYNRMAEEQYRGRLFVTSPESLVRYENGKTIVTLAALEKGVASLHYQHGLDLSNSILGIPEDWAIDGENFERKNSFLSQIEIARINALFAVPLELMDLENLWMLSRALGKYA